MGTPTSTLRQRVYRGIREYLLITLYLWLIFALFDVYKAVLLAEFHMNLVALMALCKVIEVLAVGMSRHKPLTESLGEIGGSWAGLLCLTGIFFVMLIPFCAFSELGISLGDQKLKQLFFGERSEKPSTSGLSR